MRLLIISQYFLPESGAAANRIGSFANYLTRFGHQVSVVCQVPNYPSGNIYQGYKNSIKSVSEEGGVRTIRPLTYPSQNTNIFKRLANYLLFMGGSFFAAVGEKRPDMILFSSPPIFAGLTALTLSFVWSVPLVVDIRDIWPGVASESGNPVKRILLSPLRLLETSLYKRASAVTTVSDGMVTLLVKENPILKGKAFAVYNGVDLNRLSDKTEEKIKRGRRTFTVIYSGTIGTQQNITVLLKAASRLKNHQGIKFVICGTGVEDAPIRKKISEWNLTNVKYLGLLSPQDAFVRISAADIGLVMLVGSKHNDPALPSKVFDYFLERKPVLASAGNFLKDFVEKEDCGFWIDPENPQKLSEKILEISGLKKEELSRMGERGRKLVQTVFNREFQTKKLEKILQKLPNSFPVR